MKHANAMNAGRAIMASGPLTGEQYETLQLVAGAMADNVAPTIMLMIVASKDGRADVSVGYGSRLERAYSRVEDILAQWCEGGWMALGVYASVLVPDDCLGAKYADYGWYTFGPGDVSLRELYQRGGGGGIPLKTLIRYGGGVDSGKALMGAARELYFASVPWTEATESRMLRDVEALARIDKDAHAAQMWLARHPMQLTA